VEGRKKELKEWEKGNATRGKGKVSIIKKKGRKRLSILLFRPSKILTAPCKESTLKKAGRLRGKRVGKSKKKNTYSEWRKVPGHVESRASVFWDESVFPTERNRPKEMIHSRSKNLMGKEKKRRKRDPSGRTAL